MSRKFSRRGFIGRAVAFPLIAAAGVEISKGRRSASAASHAAKSADPRLKIALNAYSFSKLLNDAAKGRGSGFSLLELVDFCAKQGFEGFDPTGYFFPGYPRCPTTGMSNKLKRRAADAGLGISGTGVRNNFTTSDKAVRAASVQHIKEWVEVAARLGVPVLRVFADTQMKAQTWESVSGGATREQVEKWIADNLRECAEHGQKYGVKIGVQNHGDFLKTSADHLSLVKRVDSPWCGPIVDTGYYKTDDPYKDMAAVAPYAVNWQIKESPVGAGSGVRTDLKKLLTLVRLSGYRGYLPIETLSAHSQDYDPFLVVPKFLAEVRQAMEATASIEPPPGAEKPSALGTPATTSPASTNASATDPRYSAGNGEPGYHVPGGTSADEKAGEQEQTQSTRQPVAGAIMKHGLRCATPLLALVIASFAFAAEDSHDDEAYRPHTPTLVYYVSGLNGQKDADMILAAVQKLPSVRKASVNLARSYVQVRFDSHVVSFHQVGQAIADAGAKAGKKFARA